MNDLPESWVACKLGDVVDYGKTKKVEPESLRPDDWVLELEDIEKDTSRILQRCSFADRQSKSTKNSFAKGDVLYGKLRPYLNKVVLADSDGYCTTEIIPLRPPADVDARFLFHWLRHPDFLEHVTAVSHGLNMPRLGTEAGKAAPFVLAPAREQQRIADKLDALLARVDACRTRLDRVPAILKRFRQAVLEAATSGALTEDWRKECLSASGSAQGELQAGVEARRRAYAGKRSFKEPDEPDLTHWKKTLPAAWVTASVSAFSECLDHLRVPVTRDKRSRRERNYPYYGANGLVDMVDEFIFDDELVLVTEDETFYGREKPIAYRASGRCWVNNHAHVLAPGSQLRANFLCFSLMHYDVLPWLTGTTGRAKLTQGVLNALPIAVPPLAEMAEIVRRVDSLYALAEALQARHESTRVQVARLTPALLAKAFRGELVPQDPNDEPAAALLERLRAAPAATTSAHTPKAAAAPTLRRRASGRDHTRT